MKKKKSGRHPVGADRRQINVVLSQACVDWYRATAKAEGRPPANLAAKILTQYWERSK